MSVAAPAPASAPQNSNQISDKKELEVINNYSFSRNLAVTVGIVAAVAIAAVGITMLSPPPDYRGFIVIGIITIVMVAPIIGLALSAATYRVAEMIKALLHKLGFDE